MPRSTRKTIRKSDGTSFLHDEIHLRQGDLDGACGPYCLAMALISLELVDRETLISGSHHGNTKIAKLIRTLEERKGDYFFRNGTFNKDLDEAIKFSFGRDIEMEYFSKNEANGLRGQDFRDFANFFVKDENIVLPVMLAITYGKNAPWAHWVLVVGHEATSDGKQRYLVLDPGSEKPRSGECWNATIEAEGSGSPLPYQFTPNRGESYRIGLLDAVGFLPRV